MIKSICFLLFFSAALFGQTGTVDVKGSFGYTGFVDDLWSNHTLTGGSVRFYVSRRLSVEPEFQYLRRDSGHDDFVAIPHINFDLREGRVVPYLSIGVGYMRSRFRDFSPAGSSNEYLAQAGGGAKVYLKNGWFISPDFRLGTELHVRASVGIGYSFGR